MNGLLNISKQMQKVILGQTRPMVVYSGGALTKHSGLLMVCLWFKLGIEKVNIYIPE